MKINTKNISILLIISLLLGTILSSKDISITLSLYNSFEIKDVQQVILNNVIFIMYTILLIFGLLMINVVWKVKGKNREVILFIISLFVTLIFFSMANLFVNTDISEKYFQLFMAKEHHNDHHKINFLAVRSVYILVLVYIGVLIFKLYHNKIEAERSFEHLKAESLQSKLTALSNQINPHFFFNALNSLHSLIIEDKKEKSLLYLSTLSNVFRYILRSESKTLVSLKEELMFLDEYRYMLEIKYGNKLTFEKDIKLEFLDSRIPVLTLLPLIENVIKHNEISNSNPMTVKIITDDDKLIISNKIKKRMDAVPSEGIGLKNLNNRYHILVNKEIIIKKNEIEFVVNLPLI